MAKELEARLASWLHVQQQQSVMATGMKWRSFKKTSTLKFLDTNIIKGCRKFCSLPFDSLPFDFSFCVRSFHSVRVHFLLDQFSDLSSWFCGFDNPIIIIVRFTVHPFTLFAYYCLFSWSIK